MIFYRIKKPAAYYLISAFVLIISGCGGKAADTSGKDEHQHLQETSSEAEHEADHTGRPDEAESAGDHHVDEEVISLSKEEIAEFGIKVERVRGGELTRKISLPGEVKLNEDRLVHVVPRFPGVVREVKKSLGDRVEAGEVLAVIESWELAEAAAQHLAATTRFALAQARFDREKALYQKKISWTWRKIATTWEPEVPVCPAQYTR